MVKAYFDFDTERNAFEMRVQGHADFAELGKDPVCAGASVLAFTAAQVIDLIDRNQLLEEPVIRISGGNVRLVCRPNEKSFCRAQTVFLFAQIGMQLLEAAYPGHVSVKMFAAADAEAIKDSSTSRTD